MLMRYYTYYTYKIKVSYTIINYLSQKKKIVCPDILANCLDLYSLQTEDV